MAEVKRGDEGGSDRRETSLADSDATVIAPRFDEREAATARPVVPLGDSDSVGEGGRGSFNWRANSRHLLLAWAVMATLAAGAVAVYRSSNTSEAQFAPQSAPKNASGGVPTATPLPVRREVRVDPTAARAAKATEAQVPVPSWEVADWSDSKDMKRDKPDEEDLDERARKEEKRRREEEKERREEFEEEAEEKAERARKEARKRGERLRERQKDGRGKARLIGVIN